MCFKGRAGSVGQLREKASHDSGLLTVEAVVRDQELVFYHAGARDEHHLRGIVAKQLGVIQSVLDNTLAGVAAHDHDFIRSLQPFDVDHWMAHNSDDTLSGSQSVSRV